MKSTCTFEHARLFNIKPLGNGCRFGIKVSSKKQDGSYTKGVFINCKHNKMLELGDYTLQGFFADNEYNGNNTLEFIVTNALITGRVQPKVTYENKPMDFPEDDDFDTEIPF